MKGAGRTPRVRRAPPAGSPLDRDEFLRRLDQLFPAFYLTLIGVIQSAALGYLVIRTLTLVRGGDLRPLPYAIIVFFVIALVSLEYSAVVALFRWYPRLPDVLIPLGFGITELFLVHVLVAPALWWLATALVNVVAGLGYVNTRARVGRDHFSSGDAGDAAYSLMRRGWWKGLRASLAGVLFCGTAALVTRFAMGGWTHTWPAMGDIDPAFWLWQIAFGSFAVLSICLFAMRAHHSFERLWPLLGEPSGDSTSRRPEG